MGEEIKETPVEEVPKVKKEKKPKTPRDGPIVSFSGPQTIPKIIALMGALWIIWQGNSEFWAGLKATSAGLVVGGIFLYIIGIIMILMTGIVQFGEQNLKKLELIEKYYRWEVLLLLSIVTLLIEIFLCESDKIAFTMMLPALFVVYIPDFLAAVFGGLLILIAAILEKVKDSEKMTASKLLCLIGIVYALIEAIMLLLNPTLGNIWDAIVGIVVIILLLLSMYDKIKFIPYEWWMVLILGFILWMWLPPGIGGRFVLISFILMLYEK